MIKIFLHICTFFSNCGYLEWCKYIQWNSRLFHPGLWLRSGSSSFFLPQRFWFHKAKTNTSFLCISVTMCRIAQTAAEIYILFSGCEVYCTFLAFLSLIWTFGISSHAHLFKNQFFETLEIKLIVLWPWCLSSLWSTLLSYFQGEERNWTAFSLTA